MDADLCVPISSEAELKSQADTVRNAVWKSGIFEDMEQPLKSPKVVNQENPKAI